MEAEFGPAASSKPTAGLRSFSKHCNRGYTGWILLPFTYSFYRLYSCPSPIASTTPTHWAGSTGLTSQAAAVTTPQSTALTQSKLQLFSKYRAQKTAAARDNTPPQKKPKSDQIKVLSFTFGTKEQINNHSFFFLQLNSFGRYAI